MPKNEPPPRWVYLRSALGVAIRTDRPHAEVEALRSELRVARLAHSITETLSAEPPLGAEQLRELHDLLDATQERS